jgi:hypothetical protein
MSNDSKKGKFTREFRDLIQQVIYIFPFVKLGKHKEKDSFCGWTIKNKLKQISF